MTIIKTGEPSDPKAMIAEAEKALADISRVRAAVGTVIFGQESVIERTLVALLAGGHALLVGVPGLAKTKLVETLGTVLGLDERRVQFTPDLMPSDIIGSEVMEQDDHGKRSFRYVKGPIFAQLLMADEINRASPRTQSALLQSMQEYHVTVAGERHDLPAPFHVLATQNPLEHFGTYPLPESQMDRFLLRLRLGYPSRLDERRVVTRGSQYDPVEDLKPAVTAEEVVAMQDFVCQVRVEESLLDYAERIVGETRRSPLLQLGVSPRGFQSWYRAAQARALSEGRDYCVPDDFRELVLPALAHRLVLPGSGQGGYGDALGSGRAEAERILQNLLERVPLP